MPGYELIGKEERDAVNKIFDDDVAQRRFVTQTNDLN